jgi:hypothetical protein
MLDPAALGLWLRLDRTHADALVSLLDSRDLQVVSDGETFTVIRSHSDVVSRLETGSTLPPLPSAIG